tara:strand:- start:3444 stop:5021 length:1578 start_codon:yes stop_codon:yes gene_type:complete
MAKEKSLVEDAITQIKGLEDVLAENAKGILRSTMKEEISDLVKESLSEQEDEEVEMELDVDDLGIDDDESEELEFDMDDDNDELENELSLDIEALGLGMDDDDEETIDLTDIDDEDEILRVFGLMGPDDNIVVTQDDAGNINLKDDEKEYMIVGEGEEETEIELEEDLEFDSEIELDEEEDFDEESIEDIVSRVFDESYGGIEEEDMEEGHYGMNKGDEYHRKDVKGHEEEDGKYGAYNEDEEEIMYEIEFDEEDEDEFTEIDLEETLEESKPKFTYGSNPNSKGFNTKMKKADPKKGTGKAKFEFKEGQGYNDEEDERLGVEDGEIKKKDFKGPKKRKSKSRRDDAHFETREGHYSKEETKEASRTLGNGKYWGRQGLNKPKAAPRNIRVENTNTKELKVLREKNEEYRKALNVFRNKLNEVAIFNSNLAYSTRLFTEHSTSKTEKINILRRFDNVDTIKESKGLYKTIKNELSTDNGNSKPMNESIGKTIDKNLSTGSSQNLIESKTYENPQFLRMKDLMSKL